MLNSEPKLDQMKSQRALETWKMLKPLNVDDILEKTDQAVLFESSDI